jgi:hypothetical protein
LGTPFVVEVGESATVVIGARVSGRIVRALDFKRLESGVAMIDRSELVDR